ncbi:MAG: hypothetical protein ACMZ7B_06010 [Balneola sp.]
MNKKRLVGVLLFSIAGLIVWFSFVAHFGELGFSNNNESLFGAASVFISAATSSFLISPIIFRLEKNRNIYIKAFGLGVFIALISMLIGSYIFSIVIIFEDIFALSDYLFFGFYGFIFSVIVMSPGLILGGLTGVLLHYLANKFDPKTG